MKRFGALVAMAIAAVLFAYSANCWAQLPANFQETTILSGLNQPIAMEFLPDGRMLLCQKGGVVKIAQGPNYNITSNYLTITNINSGQERGLIDIAIDPNFETNNYIYLYYSQAGPSRFRIARFTHQENSGSLTSEATLASEFLVWEDTDNFSSCCHYGGGLSFGPDGSLYLSVGDEFDGNQSQNLTKAGGKMIRVNPDGTIPADNPFIDGPGGNHDAIWAYGLRNPYRAKWDIPGNRLYIAEVGGNVQSTAMEDVHIGVAGANYGWPFCEANNCNWPSGEPANFSPSIYSYDHQAGTPNGGSITGGFVYRGNQFPAAYEGVYFFGDYALEYIRYLTFDASGNVTGDFDFHDDPGLVVAIDEGPDGALYYCDISGSVKRVVFDNGNQSPACVTVSSSTTEAQIGESITFDADVEDAEDDELTYEWFWGDSSSSSGAVPSGTGVRSLPQASHTYSSNGLYSVSLEISDASHVTSCQTVEVQVGNPPEATITLPVEGTFFQAGDEISYAGTATDSDGTLTVANYSWEVRFIHNDHFHPEYGPFAGMTSGIIDIPTSGHDFGDNTSFQFILQVTDNDGLTDSDTVHIYPDKVLVTYESVPAGLTINVDGIARTTPFTVDDLIGFERELVVGASQCIGDANYDFVSWSNSGGTTQTYTVPNTDETLTVTYTENGDCSAPVTFGLVLQLEGDLGVSDDGSQITGWADQSVSGNDLSMVGAGPSLVPGSLNGHNTIAFDGVDDALGRTGFTALPTANSDRSVFMVVRYNSNGWGGFSYGNNNGNQTFGLTVSGNGELAIQGWGGANDFPSSTNATDNTWMTQSVVLSNDAFSLFKNGSSIITGVHAFATATNKIRLGSEIDDTPHVTMEVAEILAYDRAVSETERQQIEAYFQQKYFPLGSGPTVNVLSPTGGEVITGDAVTVSWSTANMETGDHIHLIVDGETPHITVMQQNGSYEFTELTPGPHNVLVQVARQDHVVYTNEEASQTINFNMQVASGGGDCEVVTDGLVLHLESDLNVVTSTGTDVSGWLDQSGNGNDLSGGGAPQLITTGGPNGQPYVSFDGADDFLERTTTLTGFPSGSQDRTMFFVARYNASPVYAGASFGNGANNQTFGLIVTNNGDLAVQGWGGGNDHVSNESGTGEGWLSQSVVLENDAFAQFKNGQELNNGTHIFNTVLNRFVLAEEIDNLGFAEIDVAGVYVFNRALSEAERTQMEDYIQDKYFGVSCAPAACSIDAITTGTQTSCDPQTNTYSQEIEVTYSNPPASGTLDVNGQSFAIISSPQTVTLTGLTADAGEFSVTAQFSEETACTLTETDLFTAPVNCEPVGCDLVTDGLVLQLESDAGLVASGNTVSAWIDQSASANDLSASGTPGIGATTTPSGAAAVTFTKSENDKLERTSAISGLPAGNTDRTVFMVVDYRSDGWGGFSYGTAGNCNQVFGLIAKNNGNLTVQGWCSDFDSGVEGNNATPAWLVHSATYESDVLKQFKDGTQIGSTENHTFNTVVSSIVLGAEIDSNPYLDMDVGAILVYDRALSETERQQVENYLQLKYLGNSNDCPACAIEEITAGAQSACDPVTDTYSQDITVTYSEAPFTGTLDVNGQSFAIGTSPQTVTLTGLPADGSNVDITASFSTDAGCTLTETALFTASSGCVPEINCDFITDGLVLHLETDAGLLVSGNNVNSWSDQSPSANDLTAGGTPEVGSTTTPSGYPAITFTQAENDKLERTTSITGLPSGNTDRTVFLVTDYRSAAWGGFAYGNAGTCNEVFGLIVKPNGNLTVQGWCDDFDSGEQGTAATPGWLVQSATYESNVLRHFKDGQQIGANVNHAFNTVVNSIVLGAEIDSNPYLDMDVAAILIYDRALSDLERAIVEGYLQTKYLDNPIDCDLFCAIDDVVAGVQTACDPQTNTYSQKIDVTYTNPPATGTLVVNGQSFAITSSPQTVTLTGLIANGLDVDVTVEFSDDEICGFTATELFTAPASCAPPLSCDLLTDGLVLHLETDEGVNVTENTVNSWSDQSPLANDLSAFGSPEIGAVTTPSGVPAISFAQAENDKLERTAGISGLPAGNTDRTVFIVVDYKSNGFGGFAYGNAGSCNQVFGLIVAPNGNLMVQGWCDDFDSGVEGNLASPNWLVHSATHRAGALEQYKDGVQVGATVGHSFNTVVDEIVLGAEIDSDPYMEMDVAAVLVYDRALNILERQEVEGYLQQKYLGVPNDCSEFCSIENLSTGAQTPCDPITNTYSQELIVTYENPPTSGTLEVNGQSFAITSSPQTITLSGLVADGNPVDINAYFSVEFFCDKTETALFTAPESCAPDGPIIDVWYGDSQEFGNHGEPQVWCNIPGNVFDGDGGSITNFEYTLNGGSPVTLSIGPDGRRLLSNGDFNVDLDVADLVAGSNTVEITAIDNDNNVSTKTVTVNYTPGNTWPNPNDVDWSTLTDITEVNDVAHVVDGKFELAPAGIRTTDPGYDRLIAIGDKDWTNYEVLVPITIHSMPGGAGVGVLMRWKGHTDNPVVCPQPKCGWQPLGDIAWYRPGQLQFYEGGNTSRTLNIGTTYWYRVNVETDGVGNTNYKMKVWEDGTTEPDPWDLEKTSGPTDEQEGSLLLISHQADVTFGNVQVTPGPMSISNIQVQLDNGNTEATISWDTNQDADSRIDFGPSCAFEDGFVDDATEASSHSLTLTGLTPNSIYQYQITSENAGESVSTDCLLFSTYSSGIVSDDFCDGSLNPVWTFDDPLGDASYAFTGSATNDAWLEISVPAGQDHQLYTDGIEAANMLQPVNNADFEVEVKFESALNSPQYQQQGILVKESANKFLRFEFYSTNGGQTNIYSQAFNLPAASSAFVNQSIITNGTSPMYMRVKREGNQWIQTYSFDGTSWQTGASFTYALTPTQIGPYAGNAVGGSSPAHTAQIDYFLNLNDPIAAEDNCNPMLPPVLTAIGDQFAQEEIPQNVNISATDADGNDADLSFSASGFPSFVQLIDNSDGTAELQINPLDGDAGTYTVTIEVSDLDLQVDSETLDIVVSETGVGPSNLISDDFCDGTLADQWTFVDPQSDGSQSFAFAGLDAWLEIGVPAGNDHELWDEGIQAPHIIQSVNNTDFELVVKFNSAVTAPQFKEQGVLVKQDDNNFLRFEFYSSSSNTNAITAVMSGTGVPLSTNITANTAIGATGISPLYMRVSRTGDQWIQEYSFDGSSWIQTSSFTQLVTVNAVGLYAGNAGGNPAHTAQFDYIESTDDPISVEDECQLIEGCIDPSACNFNASANTDDDSCVYATGCDTCSGETDGTGTVVDNDADDDGDCDDTDPCPNAANAFIDLCDDCVGGDTGLEACCPMDVETSFTFATLGFSNGSATATPSGGQPPYSYQWNDPFMQTTATAIGLFPGNYSCTVTDDFGCSVEVEVPVPLFLGISATHVHPNYCNSGGYELADFIPCNPVADADAYRWEFVEQGGTALPEYTRFDGNEWLRLMWVNGIQMGTTYEVRVKARANGIWGEYDTMCTITTASNLPQTELRPQYHPSNALGQNYNLCDFAIAYNINSANNFRWRFDPDSDPNNGNEIVYVRGYGNPAVRLSWVNNLLPSSQYHVAVEARVGSQWTGYGPVHMIELDQPQASTLRSAFCNQTFAPNSYVLATSVCEANYYQFQFEPVGGGTNSIRTSGNYVCFLSGVSPALSPGDYNVRVRVNQGGVLGEWGSPCVITIGGPGQEQNNLPSLREHVVQQTPVLFPNPNWGDEVRVYLDGLSDEQHQLELAVFNIYGQRINTLTFSQQGSDIDRLVRFNEGLAPGMYMVHIAVDGEQAVATRLIVQ